ncbi:hypothetical protein AVEN_4597-1 [Araneus ventricosus]|uniref:Uncharacterized protein n=1 Tax=Araneus ventricosus TaxID=182803 RepID=A0A4Y2PI31_ARAVE|nr:hypothetical protein AVEN_4597-1 [Araneus ventricosus]
MLTRRSRWLCTCAGISMVLACTFADTIVQKLSEVHNRFIQEPECAVDDMDACRFHTESSSSEKSRQAALQLAYSNLDSPVRDLAQFPLCPKSIPFFHGLLRFSGKILCEVIARAGVQRVHGSVYASSDMVTRLTHCTPQHRTQGAYPLAPRSYNQPSYYQSVSV